MSFTPDPPAGAPDREASKPSAPRPLSLADRETEAALVAAAQLVNQVVADPSLAVLLGSQGYDAAELQAGVTLHAAAEEVFNLCQQVLGELDQAQAAFDFAWVNTREDYLEFRWIVRREYPDTYTQNVLHVLGTVTDDVHEFIAQAATSYRAAQLLHPARPLSQHEFSPDRVRAALTELRQLARLDLALRARRARAERQREERDLAIAMLNLWMRDFEHATRIALGRISHPPAAGMLLRDRKTGLARAARRIHWNRLPARFRVRFPRSH